jgi:hypothetical protein
VSPVDRQTLEIAPLPHPDQRVRERAGFDLTHPYVEQCWTPILGPSGVVVLRTLPALWAAGSPAVADSEELALSVGLNATPGRKATFERTLDRLTTMGFAVWSERGSAIGVYTQVPPVGAGRIARLPERTQRAHRTHLEERLAQLADGVIPLRPANRNDRQRLQRYAARPQRPGGAARPNTPRHEGRQW